MSKGKKSKRKVDLVSSRSDNENEDRALAAYTLEGSTVSELYKNNIDRVPPELTFNPKAAEQLIYEDICIPDYE